MYISLFHSEIANIRKKKSFTISTPISQSEKKLYPVKKYEYHPAIRF